MKIRVASDLHIAYNRGTKHQKLLKITDDDKNQILLLAGDIIDRFNTSSNEYQILEKFSKRFKAVYMILGNHEHYNKQFSSTLSDLKELFKDIDNFHIIEKEYVELDDNIALFGGTFWTNFHSNNQFYMDYASWAMNDFKAIMNNDGLLTPRDTLIDHQLCFDALMEFFETDYKTKIVMTHHLPTFNSVSERFRGSQLNHAFASNYDSFILQNKPTLWVHGHTHDSLDYHMDKTRILCNPRAYGTENGHYNSNLVIEVNNNGEIVT